MQLSITIFQQQTTQPHAHSITSTQILVGGIFIFLINIKNFPPYAIIIIYNLLTNIKSKYGIIYNENVAMLKIVIFYMGEMDWANR